MGDRWVQPHLAVRTWFAAEKQTPKVTQPCRFTPLWPPSCFHSADKSRDSRSAEVRRIWRFMMNAFGQVTTEDVWRIDDALGSGDVSGAWVAWSTAVESAPVDAFCGGWACSGEGFLLG